MTLTISFSLLNPSSAKYISQDIDSGRIVVRSPRSYKNTLLTFYCKIICANLNKKEIRKALILVAGINCMGPLGIMQVSYSENIENIENILFLPFYKSKILS